MGLFTKDDTMNDLPSQATRGVSPLLMGEEKKEKIALGYLGAFVFSLGGAVVYFILYQLNYVAGISGLVSVLLASLGYQLFSGKKDSKHSVIASAIMLVVSITLAEFLCLAFVCYQTANEYITVSFGESLKLLPELLKDTELRGEIIKELLVAYGLGALCAFSILLKKYRASKAATGDGAADNAANPADNTTDITGSK